MNHSNCEKENTLSDSLCSKKVMVLQSVVHMKSDREVQIWPAFSAPHTWPTAVIVELAYLFWKVTK